MQKYCIYKHTCTVNGKSYIGQTCQKPTKRWETGEIFESTTCAVQVYGSSIISVVRKKPGHKTAYGYHWRYLEEEEFNELHKN